MSFRAFEDSIVSSTGLTYDELYNLTRANAMLEPSVHAGTAVAWMKVTFHLEHNAAMALYTKMKSSGAPSVDELVADRFLKERARWLPTFEAVHRRIERCGEDVVLEPSRTYLGYKRRRRCFAVVQFTSQRFDVGIRRVSVESTERFVDSENWNPLVTHKVTIHSHREVDDELGEWLRRAYDSAS